MRSLVTFDYARNLRLPGEGAADQRLQHVHAGRACCFVSLYQAGPFLLDPFYHAAREPKPGVWRMRELAPDRFFSSEYFRSYYTQTGLAEEIGFFIALEDGITVVLSLMRGENRACFPAPNSRF